MKKTYWYTLIEMVFVIVIIGILMTIWTKLLFWFQSEKYYAEICINTIYGNISNYTTYAATSRILSGDIIPQKYIITLSWETLGGWIAVSGINFQYQEEENDEIKNHRTILLNEIEECGTKKKYQVLLTGNFNTISMLPWLKDIWTQQGINIINTNNENNSPIFTGELNFNFKANKKMIGEPWEEFSKIIFDTRTSLTKKQFCKLFYQENGKNSKCKERSTGT